MTKKMQNHSPNTSNYQLQVSATYIHYQTEYKTVSRKTLNYDTVTLLGMISRFTSQQSYIKSYNTRKNEVSEFCKIT